MGFGMYLITLFEFRELIADKKALKLEFVVVSSRNTRKPQLPSIIGDPQII